MHREAELLEVTKADSARKFRLSGELDLSTVERFTDAVRPELEGEGDLVLDLADLAFLDSSGLRALIQTAMSLDGRGRLVLESPRHAVLRLIEVSGLKRLAALEIRPGAAEGATSEGGPPA